MNNLGKGEGMTDANAASSDSAVSCAVAPDGTQTATPFTPGPWKVVDAVMGERVISGEPDYHTICALDKSCNAAWTIEDRATQLANGRLIAAAPCLLEAARDMDEFAWSALSPDCEEAGREIMRRLTNLRAALARATGEGA